MSNDEVLLNIKRIANNALCFDDNSDYSPALWEILNELGESARHSDELNYIGDEEKPKPLFDSLGESLGFKK